MTEASHLKKIKEDQERIELCRKLMKNLEETPVVSKMTNSTHIEARCDVCGNFTECGMYPGKDPDSDQIAICELCTHNESSENEPIKVTKLPPLEKKPQVYLTDADILQKIGKLGPMQPAPTITQKTYTFAVPNNASDIQHRIAKEFLSVARYVLEKNRSHGDTARKPISIFSKTPALERINAHIDDKLSQLIQGHFDDDVDRKLIGYLILRRIVKTEENT